MPDTENPKADGAASSAEAFNRMKLLFLSTWRTAHSQPLLRSFTRMSLLIIYKLFNTHTLFFIKLHIKCDHGM